MTEREAAPYSGFDSWQDDPYDDVWSGHDEAVPTTNTWTVDGHLRAPDDSTLTFPPPPWYRTRPAAAALIAAASVGLAVPIVLLASRTDAAPGPAQPAAVQPQAATTTEPTPGSAGTPIDDLPLLSAAPSPTADTVSAGTPHWSPTTRKPTHKSTTAAPTPITRTPISVAPAPRQAPVTATPGTGHKWGGW